MRKIRNFPIDLEFGLGVHVGCLLEIKSNGFTGFTLKYMAKGVKITKQTLG